MKNTLKIDYKNNKIIMDNTFAKNACDTKSDEYAHLQQVRRDYPNYEVVLRTIKKNHNKNTYSGLTYDYMKNYILKYEPVETRKMVLDELEEMIDISLCQNKSRRYPTIKKWFLEKYPKIANFGILVPIDEEDSETEFAETANIEFPKAS